VETHGGPFSPSSFRYTLNSKFGGVKYSITTPSWLTVSPGSGTVTTSAKTITFTVNSNARSLGPSTHTANINFNNTTNNHQTTRVATLVVNPKDYALSVGVSPSGDGKRHRLLPNLLLRRKILDVVQRQHRARP
jgi:hypothetical protein